MEKQYPYRESTLTLDAQQLAGGETIYVELGPSDSATSTSPELSLTVANASSTSPELSLTVANAISVSSAWLDATQTFQEPNEHPMTVTIVQATASGGSETKKVKLIFKPHGGLPGDSPV